MGDLPASRKRMPHLRPSRRAANAPGGVGGRHSTQRAGKPRTGGRLSTVSAVSSRRFPHTEEDTKRTRAGTASPAPARSWGAGCGKSARPVLRGVRAQGDQAGSPKALARKGQPRLLVLWLPPPRPVSTYRALSGGPRTGTRRPRASASRLKCWPIVKGLASTPRDGWGGVGESVGAGRFEGRHQESRRRTTAAPGTSRCRARSQQRRPRPRPW